MPPIEDQPPASETSKDYSFLGAWVLALQPETWIVLGITLLVIWLFDIPQEMAGLTLGAVILLVATVGSILAAIVAVVVLRRRRTRPAQDESPQK